MRYHQLLEAKKKPVEPAPSDRLLAITESPAFKAWFGNSQVVDDQGRPLICFHATTRDITTLDPGAQRFGRGGWGFYFTSLAGANRYSEHHTNFMYDRLWDGTLKAPNLMPVFLKIENPARVPSLDQNREIGMSSPGTSINYHLDHNQQFGVGRGIGKNLAADQMTRAQKQGFDGIITTETLAPKLSKHGLKHLPHGSPRGHQLPVYIVFKSEQVKSIFNRDFNPESPHLSEELR